jgi:hypothetical protein
VKQDDRESLQTESYANWDETAMANREVMQHHYGIAGE